MYRHTTVRRFAHDNLMMNGRVNLPMDAWQPDDVCMSVWWITHDSQTMIGMKATTRATFVDASLTSSVSVECMLLLRSDVIGSSATKVLKLTPSPCNVLTWLTVVNLTSSSYTLSSGVTWLSCYELIACMTHMWVPDDCQVRFMMIYFSYVDKFR